MSYFSKSLHQIKQQIIGYTTLVKQYLDLGWEGYLTTMMFNQLSVMIGKKIIRCRLVWRAFTLHFLLGSSETRGNLHQRNRY